MTTDTAARDAMIAEALPLVPIAARRVPVPAGLTVEDLESVGNVTLVEVADQYDPERGVPWKGFAFQRVKWAMQAAAAAHRRHPAGTIHGEVDGEPLPPPADPRASDPADLAAARELVSRRGALSVRRLERVLPSPAEVADQVVRLRGAMFAAVSASDVAAMMGSVMTRAKAGDLKAVKLVVDLLAPGRSGVTVNQQAVVIRSGDLD